MMTKPENNGFIWKGRFQRGRVLVEIVAVFLVATLAARLVLQTLGMVSSKQAIQSAETMNFDAVAVAVPLLIRWSMVIGLAFLTGWFWGGQRLRDYGLTFADRPLRWHLGAGLVTLAYGFLPIVAFLLLRHHWRLSGGPAHWSAIEAAPRHLNFWLFMMASSIVIPPLVEEIFFRGYAQARLATVFRPLTAILTIAVLFVFAHTQYLDGSFVGAAMIVLGIWQFSVLGLARLRTGSLIAPFFAHAIGNIPLRPQEQWPLMIVLTAIIVWSLWGNNKLVQA